MSRLYSVLFRITENNDSYIDYYRPFQWFRWNIRSTVRISVCPNNNVRTKRPLTSIFGLHDTVSVTFDRS